MAKWISVQALWLLLALLFSIAGIALSQASEATCALASYQWSFNSQNNSPCRVASSLIGVCTNGSHTVPSLPENSHYIGPTIDDANPCQCNTVTYSLMMACAGCQNRTISTWGEWSTNCRTVYSNRFPEPIPNGTKVQAWAYLDLKATSNIFSPDAAKLYENATESTALPLPRPTNALETTSVVASTTSDTSATAEPAGSSTYDTRSNAIGGGIVGGILGLATVGIVISVWYTRRKQRLKKGYNADAAAEEAALPVSSSPTSSMKEKPPSVQIIGANMPYLQNPTPTESGSSFTYSSSDGSRSPIDPPAP